MIIGKNDISLNLWNRRDDISVYYFLKQEKAKQKSSIDFQSPGKIVTWFLWWRVRGFMFIAWYWAWTHLSSRPCSNPSSEEIPLPEKKASEVLDLLKLIYFKHVIQEPVEITSRIFSFFSTKFVTGRLRSESQSLTLFYTIFDRKGIPFVYPILKNGTL